MYTISDIAAIIGARLEGTRTAMPIRHLAIDSRTLFDPAASLFFALHTGGKNGHRFLASAYEKGVRHFVVSEPVPNDALSEATVLQVADTLQALQHLAAYHRSRFTIPLIAITGSNGKTVVKEWLYQLLQDDFRIARSPKSYNSQIGVPLSVWTLDESHTLALFEAGISRPGEMAPLAAILQPTLGVFTNIGAAHREGFGSDAEKATEKARLFRTAGTVIFPADEAAVMEALEADRPAGQTFFTWGTAEENQLQLLERREVAGQTLLSCRFNKESTSFRIPFTDSASIANALTCITVLLHLHYTPATINERLQRLHAVDMRLQLKQGINGCILINDSYSADLTSLYIALQFLAQQKGGGQRTVILSDFADAGGDSEALYRAIAQALKKEQVQRVLAVGPVVSTELPNLLDPAIQLETFASTEAFLTTARLSSFHNEVILVKGARRAGFEAVVQWLETRVHQTRLEINLNAVGHNLREYSRRLQPATKLMVMVKAFAYGSGSAEIAGALQFHGVQYLGVAYVDEGIALRRSGISLPIMVMNAEAATLPALLEHNLQPVLYSSAILELFLAAVENAGLREYPVHLELETGMNRLGFSPYAVPKLAQRLAAQSFLKVESVFSHLAASEDPAQDAFTTEQAALFMRGVTVLQNDLPYPFLRHLANSAAIIRHPHLQLDMVRLGIGIYGVEPVKSSLQLEPVATLRATVAQLKHLSAGATVSYNRRGIVKEPSVIATVRIGYADGYSRRLSNGVGRMWVRGQLAPVIGTVCMDMTMIDVTGIPGVTEGDDVVLFGPELPVEDLAQWAGTIPYEIMTGISQRVKRVYFQE